MSQWSRVALGEVCDIRIGRTPARNRADFWGSGHPWLSIADMNQGRDILRTKESITDLAVRECNCREVSPGTVVLSFKLSVGKVSIARVPLYTNEAIAALPIRDAGRLRSDFLYWALRSADLTVGLDRAAKGLTLNTDKLLRIAVPLPPLDAQEHIAGVLDRVEALRLKQSAANEALGSLADAMFNDAFGDPVANPRGFPLKTLAAIVDPARPITYGILKPGPHQNDGVPYVRVLDMRDGTVDVAAVRRTTSTIAMQYKRSVIEPGDLLLSIRGHVGRISIVPDQLAGANITQDSARLAIRDAMPAFVAECLRTDSLQRWFGQRTKGAAVQGINLGDVKQAPVILPPRSEQQEFTRRIARVDSLRRAGALSAAELNALLASLQAQSFNAS